MSTLELLQNFMNGNEKVTISQKQKDWLMGQATKEKSATLKTHSDGFHDYIYLTDCHYQIKQCKTLASGGSYVGTKFIQGRYNIEKLYTIKFDSTGIINVCSNTDLKHYRTTEHTFQIINQLSNHN